MSQYPQRHALRRLRQASEPAADHGHIVAISNQPVEANPVQLVTLVVPRVRHGLYAAKRLFRGEVAPKASAAQDQHGPGCSSGRHKQQAPHGAELVRLTRSH